NLYLPIAIFLGVPLVYDVLPVLYKWRVALPFVILIIVTGLTRIYTKHNFYTDRLDWYRNYIEQYGGEKAIVAYETVPHEIVMFSWATPYEFWLLSTLEKDRTASIVIHKDLDEISWAWDNRDKFV